MTFVCLRTTGLFSVFARFVGRKQANCASLDWTLKTNRERRSTLAVLRCNFLCKLELEIIFRKGLQFATYRKAIHGSICEIGEGFYS